MASVPVMAAVSMASWAAWQIRSLRESEEDLRLYDHKPGTLLKLSRYLHKRTGGYIAGRSCASRRRRGWRRPTAPEGR